MRLGAVYLGLAVVDALALFLIYAFALDGVWELAITVALITLMINVIYLRRGLYAQRWIAPALALMSLMVVFPMIYTVYVSFTNYGDGNLLTKQQVINLLAKRYVSARGRQGLRLGSLSERRRRLRALAGPMRMTATLTISRRWAAMRRLRAWRPARNCRSNIRAIAG